MARRIKIKPNGVEECPSCGNNTEFNINSNQVAEDCCEVWATCAICGHDTPSKYRLEDVWGGCDDDNCIGAMSCWNDYIIIEREK